MVSLSTFWQGCYSKKHENLLSESIALTDEISRLEFYKNSMRNNNIICRYLSMKF